MKIKLFTIPNCLTLANLFCGSLTVLYAAMMISDPSKNYFLTTLILILVAAVFDFLDGFVARLLKQYSEIGLQLDSLADMVSFGLAPSLVFMAVYVKMGGSIMWSAISLSVVLCSALRLAKFNIDTTQRESFVGLPTPACALFATSGAYFLSQAGMPTFEPAIILIISVLFAWLLISPVRMFSLKFHDYSPRNKQNVVRYGFLIVAACLFAFTFLKGIWCIIILYILTSIIVDLFGGRNNDAAPKQAE